MRKSIQNLFQKGLNNSLRLPDRNNFSYRGSWIGVHNNTVMDSFHLGDFSSAIYQVTVEYSSQEKEIMQLSVVARPGEASATVFGRATIGNNLINLSVQVDETLCKVIVNPASVNYNGAKLIFHATYAETIHPLEAPAILVDGSTEDSGINTFDSTFDTFDNTNVTFDRV